MRQIPSTPGSRTSTGSPRRKQAQPDPPISTSRPTQVQRGPGRANPVQRSSHPAVRLPLGASERQVTGLARRLQSSIHRVTPSLDLCAAGLVHHDPLVMCRPAAQAYPQLLPIEPPARISKHQPAAAIAQPAIVRAVGAAPRGEPEVPA